MSGGQRIDDHSFWAGSKGKDSVFPDGPHKTKPEHSANGVGELSHYEDTTETIKSQQEMANKKVRGHPQKAGHRY
jgi:hypothetical protein